MLIAASIWLLTLQDTEKKVEKPEYVKMDRHDPNGIGISYMGREIAQVMGHLGAPWLDRPERYREEAPQVLIDALKLKPGMVVADIGAGSGYLTFPMAKRVAPNGKVIAEEIQNEMLDIIRRKMTRSGVKNIDLLLGTTEDPKLPPESVDLALMVDVYHEFDKPYEMISNMIKGMKKGGQIVFVEYRKEDPRVPIKEVHKMSEKQVKKEMSIFPLKWVRTDNSLPWQHVMFFEKV
jgi:ubiquinone/menaquinone biosynthesis C-methylase UbiE